MNKNRYKNILLRKVGKRLRSSPFFLCRNIIEKMVFFSNIETP